MTVRLEERIKAHYRHIDSLQPGADVYAIPQMETRPDRAEPSRFGLRRFPAVAMVLSFLAILTMALAMIWASGLNEPEPATPVDLEEQAVRSVQAWADAIRDGDAETAVSLYAEGSHAAGWLPASGRLGWLLAIGADSRLGECEAETGKYPELIAQSAADGTLIYVSCVWTISDPVSVAIDSETANLEFFVNEEGELTNSLGVGVRLAWRDPFIGFARANYPEEFEDACLPLSFNDEQLLGHSLTPECGLFYMSIADEIVESLE